MTLSAQVVRRAYGKPWSQLIGETGSSPEFLTEIGKILVKHIIKEARKDLAKQGMQPTPRGQPEGLPVVEDFFKSWSYHVSGQSTVEILCSWPWIEQILEGRAPFRMTWLRQTKGVPIAPLHSRGMGRRPRSPPGRVVFRTTPGKWKRSWIHPGFAKHNFVDRAFRKAKTEITSAATKRLAKALSTSTNWR